MTTEERPKQRFCMVHMLSGDENDRRRFDTRTAANAVARVMATKFPGEQVVVLEAVAVACSEPGPVVFTDPTDIDGESF